MEPKYRAGDRIKFKHWKEVVKLGKLTKTGMWMPLVLELKSGIKYELRLLKALTGQTGKIVHVDNTTEPGVITYKVQWLYGRNLSEIFMVSELIDSKVMSVIKCDVSDRDIAVLKHSKRMKVQAERRTHNKRVSMAFNLKKKGK